MITRKELRELTYKKIRTIKRLIKDEEWEVAAYLMGYVLECALKAASCKALHLDRYPPVKSKGGKVDGFKTHEFEQLLIVSGLNDLYGSMNATAAYQNWSDFTTNYPGVWTEMRYQDMSDKLTPKLVKEFAANLYGKKDSIIETIKAKKRW